MKILRKVASWLWKGVKRIAIKVKGGILWCKCKVVKWYWEL